MASWDKKEEASSPLNHDTGSGGSSGSSSVSSSLWVLRLQNAIWTELDNDQRSPSVAEGCEDDGWGIR
eukprot:s3814_g8.t1